MEKYHDTKVEIVLERKNRKSKLFFWRQLLVSSGVWVSFFSFGLATGAPTVAIPQVRKEANSTDAVTMSMASWITAGNNYGAFIAVIFTSIASHFVGRKPIFIFAAVITLTANMLLYFSVNTSHILISQVMQGVNGACTLTIDLMIIGEYTTSHYRGIFLTIKTAMMYWGIWTSNAIGTFFHWKNIGIVGIVCSFYTITTSSFWPESPFWLAEKGRLQECTNSLRWLKGQNENSDTELQFLLKTNENTNANVCINDKHTSFLQKANEVRKGVIEREFIKPTLLGMLILVTYHSTGKYVLSVYAIDIIKNITNNDRTSYIVMLFLDGITVFGMYVGCVLSKFVKRRLLFLNGSVVGILSLFLTSGYLYLIHLNEFQENKYVTVTLLTLFSISISMGPIVLSSSLIAEIAPLRLRSLSFFILIFFNFIVAANAVKLAPLIFASFYTHGAFFLYASLSTLFLVLLYKYLPETKDKTLHEIRELMIGQ